MGVSIFISFLSTSSVQALKSDDICFSVEAIFARGSSDSGKNLRDLPTTSFMDSLGKSNPAAHIYILGDEAYNSNQYPHVTISGFDDNLVGTAGVHFYEVALADYLILPLHIYSLCV